MHHRNYTQGRLTRSSDGYLAGICEGLGRHFGISPNLLRLLWVGAVLVFGTGLLLYLALWWIVPRDDQVVIEPLEAGQTGRLVRTGRDRKVFGVCGGLARYWDMDPSLVRLAALSVALFSAGLLVVAYLVAVLIIPGAQEQARRSYHPVDL